MPVPSINKTICDDSCNVEVCQIYNPKQKHSRAVEISVIGRSLKLVPWLWTTSVISFIAMALRLHEAHPAFLISVIIGHLIILLYRIQSKVISEKLLVVSGLGVQTTLTFFTGKCTTRFIPWVHLLDIIIAETITMQQVLFFMAILTKAEDCGGEDQIYPLFLHAWPRLYCLQEIYRSCQEALHSKMNLKQSKEDCL